MLGVVTWYHLNSLYVMQRPNRRRHRTVNRAAVDFTQGRNAAGRSHRRRGQNRSTVPLLFQ